MTAREELTATIEHVLTRLPAEANLSDLIEELEVMRTIEEGLSDVQAGRLVSFEEMLKRTEVYA